MKSALALRKEELGKVGNARAEQYTKGSGDLEVAIQRHWKAEEAKLKDKDGKTDPKKLEEVKQKGFQALQKQHAWGKSHADGAQAEVARLRNEAELVVKRSNDMIDLELNRDLGELNVWAEKHKGFFAGLWAALANLWTTWSKEAKADTSLWEKEKAAKAKEQAADDFAALADLQGTLKEKGKSAVEAALAKMSADKAAVYREFLFGGKSAIDVVAKLMTTRLVKDRLPELRTKLEQTISKELSPAELQRVAGQLRPGFSAIEVAQEVRDSISGHGTKEDRLFAALKGLNAMERAAVRAAYNQRFAPGNFDADIKADLSGAELEKGEALLRGDKKGADAADLKDAVGAHVTDLKAFTKIMRDKTPAEIEDLKGQYLRDTGRRLEDDLRSSLGPNRAKEAEALLSGDTAKADAMRIEFDIHGVDMKGTIFSKDTKDAQATIEQIRQEVKKDVSSMRFDSVEDRRDYLKREYQRRIDLVRKAYGDTFARSLEADLQEQLGGTHVVHGRDVKKPTGDLDLMNALLAGDETAIDAAKLSAEKQSTYVSDSSVVDVLRNQVARARAEVREENAKKFEELQKKLAAKKNHKRAIRQGGREATQHSRRRGPTTGDRLHARAGEGVPETRRRNVDRQVDCRQHERKRPTTRVRALRNGTRSGRRPGRRGQQRGRRDGR